MLTRIDLAVEGPEGSAAPDAAAGAPAVARLVGTPAAADAPDLTRQLAALLGRHRRLVVEVSELDTDAEDVALALPAAMDAAGGWPDVQVVLAAPRATLAAVLTASRADQRVLVCPSVAVAAEHFDRRPPLVRAFWEFAVSPTAPGAARGYVRHACAAWEVDDEVREAAEIVVTELVTNAVEHASSASLVDVERGPSSFRLAVRDWDTAALPSVALPPATSPRGRGLAMVAAVAADWGIQTHPDGKTVWAEMSTA